MSERPRRIACALATVPIQLYRRFLSPALPRRCKYEPTCSAYAVEAIRSFGVVKGALLALWRLARCNPLSHGGYDPVDGQRLFGTIREARKENSEAAGVRT